MRISWHPFLLYLFTALAQVWSQVESLIKLFLNYTIWGTDRRLTHQLRTRWAMDQDLHSQPAGTLHRSMSTRGQTAQQRAYLKLRNAVLSGAFKPGEVL